MAPPPPTTARFLGRLIRSEVTSEQRTAIIEALIEAIDEHYLFQDPVATHTSFHAGRCRRAGGADLLLAPIQLQFLGEVDVGRPMNQVGQDGAVVPIEERAEGGWSDLARSTSVRSSSGGGASGSTA